MKWTVIAIVLLSAACHRMPEEPLPMDARTVTDHVESEPQRSHHSPLFAAPSQRPQKLEEIHERLDRVQQLLDHR